MCKINFQDIFVRIVFLKKQTVFKIYLKNGYFSYFHVAPKRSPRFLNILDIFYAHLSHKSNVAIQM